VSFVISYDYVPRGSRGSFLPSSSCCIGRKLWRTMPFIMSYMKWSCYFFAWPHVVRLVPHGRRPPPNPSALPPVSSLPHHCQSGSLAQPVRPVGMVAAGVSPVGRGAEVSLLGVVLLPVRWPSRRRGGADGVPRCPPCFGRVEVSSSTSMARWCLNRCWG
jgi:hypothetical protein